MLRDVFSTSLLKFCLRELILQASAADERLLQSQHRGLNQLADNHASARSDRWPTVRNIRSVGLSDFKQIVIERQGFGRDLRKDRVGSLTNLSAGRENLDAPFSRRFGAHNRLQVNLARSGKSRAV